MARPRRPSAFQTRPAMLPPGTHFRGSVETVAPTVDGDLIDADVDDAREVVDPAAQPVQPDPPDVQVNGDTTIEPKPTRRSKRKPRSKPEPEPEPEPLESVTVVDESVDLPATDEGDDAEHLEPVEEPVEEPVDEPVEAAAEVPPAADDESVELSAASRRRRRGRQPPTTDEADEAEHPEPVEAPVEAPVEELVEAPVDDAAEAPPTADDADGTAVTERPEKSKPGPLSRKRSRTRSGGRSRKRSSSLSREPEPGLEPGEEVAVQDESVEARVTDEPDDAEHQEPVGESVDAGVEEPIEEPIEERVEEPVEEPTEEPTHTPVDHVARPSWAPVSPGTGGEFAYQPRNPSAGPQAHPAVGNRRSALVVAGLVLVLIATAFVTTRLMAGGDDPEPDDAAPNDSSAPNEGPSQSAPGGVPGDGTHNEIWVLPSGDLAVRQLIQSTTPLSGLSLSVPTDPFLDEGPRVSDLVVVADGVEVDGPDSLGSTPVSFSVAGAQTIDLMYRLSGVLVRSTTRPERALARAIWLDSSYEPRGGPTTVSFEGATVLDLVCTDGSARKAPVPCGRRMEGDGWEVEPPNPEDDTRVMAMVELPSSRSG